MPYPSYMDQLGAWSSSPSPLDPGAQYDPTSQPTASIAGSSDPNANMSSQDIMDMIRKKQQDYQGQAAGAPASAVDTYTAPPSGSTDDEIAARSRAYGDDARSAGGTGPVAGPGVAIQDPEITRQIDATSAVAGLGDTPPAPGPTVVPSNQNTVIGNPIYNRNLTPEQRQNILALTQDDPTYNSATVNGSTSAAPGQSFTMTPGRRIPLAVAASMVAKQQLDKQLAMGNDQAQLATDRRAQLAAVPGQSAVNLQNARNTGAQAIQGMQNTNEQTLQAQRLSQQQQQWEDQRPLREAQVRQLASQSGMNDAETKAKLAAIDNMDTPQSRTARAAMQYATALDPNDPSKGDIFMQALNSLGGQPGAAGGGTAGIAGAVGQANQYGADRNTAQYMATDPEYAATVKALKGAKPGIGTAIAGGIAKAANQDFGISNAAGMGTVKQNNENKWVQAVQQTQDHFNTIAARKHLNAKALMDGAMKQVQ